MSVYKTRPVEALNSNKHRVFIEKDGVVISPLHDIPLYANAEKTIFNFVVEVPRWTNAKLEIARTEPFNPIKQDTHGSAEKIRFVRNCFPHHGYIWNYGAFPQTWEDPNVVHPETGKGGDNDPLDVCEIGEQVGYTGQVKQVKILGVMALLDQGETDWKVIVVDVTDPLADRLKDIEDVEKALPGLIRATNEWFRIYKIPDGKTENTFAFSGEAKNKKYATDIVHETHEAWKRLISGSVQFSEEDRKKGKHIERVNLTIESPFKVSTSSEVYKSIPEESRKHPLPIDPSIDKWFFISGSSL